VDGVGVDPAPGGTGIQVDLLSTDTARMVTEKTRLSILGWQVSTIVTIAGSSVPASSYFNASSVSENFYVWYKVDGMGTDPAVPARIGIQVDIASTDTAAQVATKTQIAINMQYFAVPDYRGLFLRGYSGTNAFNDPQADIRASVVPGVVGNEIGTFQFDDILSHFHGYDSNNYVNPGSSGGASAETVLAADTDPAGGYESRPKNMAINFAIIY